MLFVNQFDSFFHVVIRNALYYNPHGVVMEYFAPEGQVAISSGIEAVDTNSSFEVIFSREDFKKREFCNQFGVRHIDEIDHLKMAAAFFGGACKLRTWITENEPCWFSYVNDGSNNKVGISTRSYWGKPMLLSAKFSSLVEYCQFAKAMA